jgi:peptidoglycan hydrolase-like protein with peptidoglycan-binding domain
MVKAQSIQSSLLALALLAGGAVAAIAGTAPSSLSSSGGKSSAKTAASTSKTASTSSSAKGAIRKTVKRRPVKPRAQLTPTSERISEIQSALAGQGAFQGDPTGRWDDGTVEAMKKFQSAQGLTPSGKLDARTLERLGLGSDTAGRGAPVPPANPAPNLLLSRSQQPQTPPQDDK